ncbi:hypothetical protein [Candidatus Scalindua japonica]|nr:hypothetical protein [Candidatus Scalindua japonica]
MNLMILAIVSISAFTLHLRTIKLPLHPDSGYFLYIPFFKRIGYFFSPSKVISSSPPIVTGDYNILGSKFLLRSFAGIIFFLGGKSKSFRIFYAFYNLLTGIAIYKLASQIGSPLLGLIAASIYLIMSLSPYHDSFQLHAEQYAYLPMILALIAVILAGTLNASHIFTVQSIMLLLVSGLLLGMVIMCLKITYAVEAFIICCFSLSRGLGVWGILFMICGIALFVSFILVYTFIRTRSIDLFVYTYFPKMFLYYKKSMPAEHNIFKFNVKTYFIIFSCFLFGICCFLAGIILSVINHNTSIIIISILPFVSMAGIWFQNKFYMSHFYSLLPFSSIVAAYGVKQMLGFTGLGFVFFVVISLLLLIPALLQIFQYYLKYDALTFHIKTSQVINQKHTLNFIAEEGIAEYVKRNSAKDDFVLQWGYNHEFYVLAQRRASLRGHLASTLMTDPQLNDAMYINWKKDVLSDIEKLTPAFIVDFDGSLRIETVNKVSGHRYKLEKNVYGIYPLYRLVDTHTSRKRSTATEILKSLTENDTRRTINNKIFDSNSVYIKYVNNLVMKDRLKEADIYSEGGITEMFDDWRRINNQ